MSFIHNWFKDKISLRYVIVKYRFLYSIRKILHYSFSISLDDIILMWNEYISGLLYGKVFTGFTIGCVLIKRNLLLFHSLCALLDCVRMRANYNFILSSPYQNNSPVFSVYINTRFGSKRFFVLYVLWIGSLCVAIDVIGFLEIYCILDI